MCFNKMNVFVKPNEQRRASSDIVMARKRTFRGTRKEVYLSTIINLKNECYEKNVFTRKGMWQTVRHALAQLYVLRNIKQGAKRYSERKHR